MQRTISHRIKGIYVMTMRGIGTGLAKLGIRPKPSRQHRIRHWANSLTKVYDTSAMVDLDVPWWTYSSIDAVDAWLTGRRRPVRVFEYGSGASTIWLARRADEVYSVEHHPGFAATMQPFFDQHANVSVAVVEPVPSANPVVPSHKPGHQGLDFAAYVAAIESAGTEFDLIVIDGRAREACLTAALPKLAEDGIILFDNTRRARYREAIDASGLEQTLYRGLTPTLPYPDQTSVLSR